jgi:uncharacterized protein YoaH (UPF0181 family)
VERPADERAIKRSEGLNGAQTKLNDVLPLIESNLTIQEVAARLGISVEAACTLVVASLRSRQDGTRDGSERFREEENAVLVEAGFKPAGGTDLWHKGAVCYGRLAALQNVRRDRTEARRV